MVAGQDVTGQINLDPMGMGKGHPPPQVILVKVLRGCPHTKLFAPQIDRVGAKLYRRYQTLIISCRRQYLRPDPFCHRIAPLSLLCLYAMGITLGFCDILLVLLECLSVVESALRIGQEEIVVAVLWIQRRLNGFQTWAADGANRQAITDISVIGVVQVLIRNIQERFDILIDIEDGDV